MRKTSSEVGSISVFVIIAFIFCMTILINIYWSSTNYQVTVLQAQQRIQEIYGEDVKNMDSIHANLDGATPSVDSSYWKTGAMKLCTIDGRDYNKINAGGTICGAGYWYGNGVIYASPILVSTSEEAVKYTTSYDNKTWGSYMTINYDGVTYYCAGDTYAMHDNFDFTNIQVINTKSTVAESHQALVTMLLDKYFRK